MKNTTNSKNTTISMYDINNAAQAKEFNANHLGNKNFSIVPDKPYTMIIWSLVLKENRNKQDPTKDLIKKDGSKLTGHESITFTSTSNAINVIKGIQSKDKNDQNLKTSVVGLIPIDMENESTDQKKSSMIFYLVDGRPLTDHFKVLDSFKIKQAKRAARAERTTDSINDEITEEQQAYINSLFGDKPEEQVDIQEEQMTSEERQGESQEDQGENQESQGENQEGHGENPNILENPTSNSSINNQVA